MANDLILRLRALFTRTAVDQEIDDELRFHVDRQIESLKETGLDEAAAARRARLEFGGVEQVKEEYRDALGVRLVDELWQDLRFAWRRLLTDRWVTLAAVATLALGIGANSAVFTVVNAVLLRSLPVDHPEQIVWLDTSDARGRALGMSRQDFEDWRRASRTFSSMALVFNAPIDFSGDDRLPERYPGAALSPAGLSMLGAHAVLGRSLREEDDVQGAPPVVVLSSRLWKSRYAADPNIVGRTVHVNTQAATIVGVLSEGVPFPVPPPSLAAEAWTPISSLSRTLLQRGRERRFYTAYGRLADGVTAAQARAELANIAATLAQEYPNSNKDMAVAVMSLSERIIGRDIRTNVLALMGAVAFVLLIACANVANLLLARAAHRSREIAVRVALGATRWRLVRQLLLENLLLSGISGAIGLALAAVGLRWFDANLQDVARAPWMTFTMDARVVAFFAVVCIVTAILFGLAPALHISKANVHELVKEGGRSGSGSLRVRRWTSALVVAELALTLVLLSGAGLLVRTFLNLSRMDVGFDSSHLLTMRVLAHSARYPKFDDLMGFLRRVDERLNAVSGIEAASTTSGLPLSGSDQRQFAINGRSVPPGERLPSVMMLTVGTRYFEAVGVPLRQGRGLIETDGEPGHEAAVINQQLAAMYFPGQNPIGQQIRLSDDALGEPQSAWATIVGVAPTIRQRSLQEAPDPDPVVYIPHRQNRTHVYGSLVMVRSHSEWGPLIAQLRQEVASLDPDLPLAELQTMDEVLAERQWSSRTFGTLLAVFAGVALFLAAIGLYAVTAYSVTQRTSEMGIRIALGAQPRHIVGLIGGRIALQVAVGIGVGLAGAIGVGRILKSVLVQTTPTDPVILVSIVLVLVVVAIGAAFWPTWQALRLNPATVLRGD